jgi:quercetin dioxygenase-like cupin family protein
MPKVFHYDAVEAKDVEEGCSDVRVRWLIAKEMGAKNFAMRLFEIGLGGFTPLHRHKWEHEVFVLEGEGSIFNGKKATPFKASDAIFVPPNERHQFKNTGKDPLKILCLIPYIKE